MVQQTDKIGGSARSEPVVAQHLLVKSVQQAEGVVDVRQGGAEVVAVILSLQHLLHLHFVHLELLRHLADCFGKDIVYLLLRDAAECIVTLVHADVLGLVEAAEHADLRKLRNARKHHEPQIGIGILEHAVETFQHIAVVFFELDAVPFAVGDVQAAVEHVEQGLVILVNQHHDPAPRGAMCRLEHRAEALAERLSLRASVPPLALCHIVLQHLVEHMGLCKVFTAEREVEHGMLVPLLFQRFNGQAPEQFLVAQKIVFQRGEKEALAEAARTAQEIDSAVGREVVNQCRLVHVHVAVLTQPVEALYADGVFHDAANQLESEEPVEKTGGFLRGVL